MAALDVSEALPDMLLIGRIDQRRIALPARSVERILPMVEVKPLAGAGPHVLGLMNLHGTILPVVNLRPILELENVELDPAQHLVIIATHHRYALWIDQAETVVQAVPASFERVTTAEGFAPLVFRLASEVISVLSLAVVDPGPLVGSQSA